MEVEIAVYSYLYGARINISFAFNDFERSISFSKCSIQYLSQLRRTLPFTLQYICPVQLFTILEIVNSFLERNLLLK